MNKCCIDCQYIYKLYDSYICPRRGVITEPSTDSCGWYKKAISEEKDDLDWRDDLMFVGIIVIILTLIFWV